MGNSKEEQEIWRKLYAKEISTKEGLQRLTIIHAREDLVARRIGVGIVAFAVLLLVCICFFKGTQP